MVAQEPLVLIIDDEDSILDSCSQILLKSRYRVETAKDGDSGLRKVRDFRPDAVIVDLKMPGTSGFEVLEGVQAADPLITSIVMTGYATVDSAVEAMKKGAYDFLPKPFSPDELRMVLARALEHRRLALEADSLRREKKILEDNFITMVSHQLRSPLVAIQQYFEVLLAGMAGAVDDKPKEMIRRAGERLQGLLNLINDWLDLARIDKGRLVDRLKPVDLAEILIKLIDFMRPSAGAANVSLEWDGPSRPAPAVLGDEESLEQVFANLISNAIKFNRPLGRVSVSLQEDPDWVSVEVRDTGIGIAPEHLPFLFDQFYQVRRGANKGRGSGLGLSIAKKVVEAHNGRIDVTSEPGVGSAFTVRIPRSLAEKDQR
jgi:two-component system sensor histidine kinase/response regulator